MVKKFRLTKLHHHQSMFYDRQLFLDQTEVECFNRALGEVIKCSHTKEKTERKKSNSFYYRVEQEHVPSLMHHQPNLFFAIYHIMIYHQLIPTTN